MVSNETLKRAIDKIARDNGVEGLPSAGMIVDAVRGHPDHELYEEFPSSDEEAAYECWKARAQKLIGRVTTYLKIEHTKVDFGSPTMVTRVYAKNGFHKVRAFIRDPQKRWDEPGMIEIVLLAKQSKKMREKAMDERAKTIAGHVRNARAEARQLNLEAYFERLLEAILHSRDEVA
jgi:hypothetical protein